MKLGYRKPSPKRSLKARTTGKVKRAVKKSVTPGYGQNGMGYVKNPKKAVYNKIYNKTTRSVYSSSSQVNSSPIQPVKQAKAVKVIIGIALIIAGIVLALSGVISFPRVLLGFFVVFIGILVFSV